MPGTPKEQFQTVVRASQHDTFPYTVMAARIRWLREARSDRTAALSQPDYQQHLASNFLDASASDNSALIRQLDTTELAMAGSTQLRISYPSAVSAELEYVTAKGLHLLTRLLFDADENHRVSAIHNTLKGNASMSALDVAAARATHLAIDGGVILRDTLARPLAGEIAEARISRTVANPSRRDNRLMICARSRLAEDELAWAYERGVRQYVLLGAGLDSYGYRMPPEFTNIRVFEVDRQESQAWKQERLAASDIRVPPSLRFVPADLCADDVDHALASAGFEHHLPAVVAWTGVTYYLPYDAVESLFAAISRWPRGTSVIVDYILPRREWQLYGVHELEWFQGVAARTDAAGEPWLTFFTPQTIEHLLRRLGFDSVEHFDYQYVQQRFALPTALTMRPAPFMRVVRALHN